LNTNIIWLQTVKCCTFYWCRNEYLFM